MSPEPTLVNKPAARRGPQPKYPIDLLVKTVGTGKAVRVAAGHRKPRAVVSALHHLAKRRGFRLHYRIDGRHVVAWLEQKTA